jgi:hypothetical protein
LWCSGIEKPINQENEMFTDLHQTGTLEVSHRARSVGFGLTAGGLIVGVAIASLLAGLIWNHSSVRYPGASRQAAAQFQLRFQPTGNLSQQSAYQTSDDLPQVLGWYTRHLGLDHEMPQGDHCVTMTRVSALLFFQRALTVSLCAHPMRTLIFINRSLLVVR